MKKTIILLTLAFVMLLGFSVSSASAITCKDLGGTVFNYDAKKTKKSIRTGKYITFRMRTKICKYWSKKLRRNRFKVQNTYSAYEPWGNYIKAWMRKHQYVWTWYGWSKAWSNPGYWITGPTTRRDSGWIFMGRPNKYYNAGQTVRIKSPFKISDGGAQWTYTIDYNIKPY